MGRNRNVDKSAKAQRKNLWQKLKSLTTQNNNDGAKRKLFYLLSIALQGGAKVGKQVIVGTNTVLKGISSHQVSVVCVSRDSPKAFFNCLVEACALNAIPIVALPSASAVEMASIFSLKKATVFALPLATSNISKKSDEMNKSNEIDSNENDGVISDDDRMDSMIDGVRDAALAMCTPNFLFREQRESSNTTTARDIWSRH